MYFPFYSLINLLYSVFLCSLVLLGIIIHICNLLKSLVFPSTPYLIVFVYCNFACILNFSKDWECFNQCCFLFTHKSLFSSVPSCIAIFSSRIMLLLSSELPLIFLLFKSVGKTVFQFCFSINIFTELSFGRIVSKGLESKLASIFFQAFKDFSSFSFGFYCSYWKFSLPFYYFYLTIFFFIFLWLLLEFLLVVGLQKFYYDVNRCKQFFLHLLAFAGLP